MGAATALSTPCPGPPASPHAPAFHPFLQATKAAVEDMLAKGQGIGISPSAVAGERGGTPTALGIPRMRRTYTNPAIAAHGTH